MRGNTVNNMKLTIMAKIRETRVIFNGQIRVRRGWGEGVVGARWRRGGHKGHSSLKFEKDGSLA